jgi:hypothetical protein
MIYLFPHVLNSSTSPTPELRTRAGKCAVTEFYITPLPGRRIASGWSSFTAATELSPPTRALVLGGSRYAFQPTHGEPGGRLNTLHGSAGNATRRAFVVKVLDLVDDRVRAAIDAAAAGAARGARRIRSGRDRGDPGASGRRARRRSRRARARRRYQIPPWIGTGRQYATESRGTFVQKCVLSAGTRPIDLAAAWPAHRVRLRLEIPTP